MGALSNSANFRRRDCRRWRYVSASDLTSRAGNFDVFERPALTHRQASSRGGNDLSTMTRRQSALAAVKATAARGARAAALRVDLRPGWDRPSGGRSTKVAEAKVRVLYAHRAPKHAAASARDGRALAGSRTRATSCSSSRASRRSSSSRLRSALPRLRRSESDSGGSAPSLWLVLPLAAIVHLARTGDLLEAQLISLFGLAVLALIVTVGAGLSPELSLGWLMLLPLEAAISGSSSMLRFASLLAHRLLLALAARRAPAGSAARRR